jgi:excisionase family DNA binding protein
MAATQTKSSAARKSNRTKNSSEPTDKTGSGEVLTLDEAAAFLRVEADELLRLVALQGLPARRIGSDWRFLKSALQDWLGTPVPRPSKEAVLAVIGSWKDDPELDDMLKEIYKRRARPMTGDDA